MGTDPEADPQGGFASATVLGLLAIMSVLGVAALHDALFGEQLAGSRLLHLRAQSLAGFGIEDGFTRLKMQSQPEDSSYALRPMPGSGESVEVSLRHVGVGNLPAGFSSGEFALHRFEIESTGFTSRGIRSKQVQGVARVLPVGGSTP
jgi:hypothetical protein